MSVSSVNPEPILRTCAGLWAAGLLKSAVELKLFDQLAPGPRDVHSMSQAIAANPESLQILLDALVALGFVQDHPNGYALTDVSAAFLVSSQPTYLGMLVADALSTSPLFDLYRDYRRVITEGYHQDVWGYETGTNERLVNLTRGLFTFGYPLAQTLADHLGWTPGKTEPMRILDVGCGSAVYGLEALTRMPYARLTAQDYPLVLPVAQEFAAQLGVTERVQMLPGDCRTITFDGPYDAIIIGNVLAGYPVDTCRHLLRKCFAALAAGGVVIVLELFAERGRPESMFSWLFSTLMHGTSGGRAFSTAELILMLTECGAQRTDIGGGVPAGFVLGYGR